MRFNAMIAGVGMTPFGKHIDKGLKALGAEATRAALADAGIEQDAIQAAWVGNAAAGLVTGQESIRGQVILRSMGIGKIPVINIDNACGSASTAFNQACAMVSAGLYDVVLALGAAACSGMSSGPARGEGVFGGAGRDSTQPLSSKPFSVARQRLPIPRSGSSPTAPFSIAASIAWRTFSRPAGSASRARPSAVNL